MGEIREPQHYPNAIVKMLNTKCGRCVIIKDKTTPVPEYYTGPDEGDEEGMWSPILRGALLYEDLSDASHAATALRVELE
jgi:hypothetical protein